MKIENILGDNIGFIELVDCMGGDVQVVNSARVSYGKETQKLTERDIRLIKRLITDKHVSVLRSTVFNFRVKVPMAIRNQWYRHVIGGAYANDQIGWNEISRRYTDQNIEFYIPLEFRGQDPNNKQASVPLVHDQERLREWYLRPITEATQIYESLLKAGVAREQARMVLPQCLYTEFLWTASLQAVLHFLDLRDKIDSQWEIQQYAKAVILLISDTVPETLKMWKEK